MRIMLILAGILFAGWSQCLIAAPNAPSLADYRATYEREQNKIRTNNASVLVADADYLKALEALQSGFKQQGDFEGTLAVVTERKRFEATRMVPDAPTNTLPAVIVKAQADYRAVLARTELEKARQSAKLNAAYVKALKELIKTYLAADKMTEAAAVDKEIKKAEAEIKFAEAEVKSAEASLPTASGSEASGGSEKPAETETPGIGLTLPLNLRKGLVLYYNFNKDEEKKISDVSGKKNDGIIKGATWTPQGKSGGAMEFDGQSSYVMVPSDSPAFKKNTPDAGFALSAWFKTSSPASQILLSKGVSDLNEEYSVNIEKGQIYFDYGAGQAYVVVAANVTDNEWHLLVATYNTSWNPKGKVYVDGEEKTTMLSKGTGSHIPNTGSNVYIGTQNAGSPYYPGRASFTGLIDEVAIWTRSLDASAVKELFSRP